ncbi:MAG: DUF5719 family protein [Streptosporangiales bacterium]|nr:DUF5719 family protein [Streptosporangiales bacterium]
MNRSRRYTLPVFALLTLALVYLVAWAAGPGGPGTAADSSAPRTAPVTAVTRDCPPSGPGGGQAHVAEFAAPSPAFSAGQAGRAPAQTGVRSSGNTGGAGGSATEVTATGTMARGFESEQSGDDGTGLVTCQHPGSDMWFVGTGTKTGGSATWLYLTNTGAMPASTNVTVLTDTGVRSAQDNQVTVPPHRYVGVNIASQAGASQELAVHVQTSSGQVAADVWQDGGSGGAWLPAATAPATAMVVPGVTAAGGAPKLLVAVPGEQDAQVRVTALTAQGQTRPLGTGSQDATGGATSSFSLGSLGSSAAALVVSSNVPITASVQDQGDGVGAFTAATPPVTGQGVVAGNPSGGGSTAGLALSAPAARVRAAITVLPSSSSGRTLPAPQQTVTVQSRHTAQVKVTPPKGARGPFAIVVTPLAGSGPLYAARTVSSGGLSGKPRALLPVVSVYSRVRLPAASENYGAVQP